MNKYLKGLDTLRAIAALIVVWWHIELLKKGDGLIHNLSPDSNVPKGHIAVILFFVISGFLITYLLVKEREKDGSISFKKFYLRRILRIWPLYYLIMLLSFLFFSTDYSQATIFLCLSIFPNVAHAINEGWTTSPQIWSIGVEEQFYLFWPLLLTLIPERRIPAYLIIFFIGYSLLPFFIGMINGQLFQNEEMGEIINKFLYGTKFNCMSIGALIGFLYAKKSKHLNLINNNITAIISIALAALIWAIGFEFQYLNDEFYSIVFALALFSIVANPNIHIDSNVSSFVGKISYGIYMYHWIIILFAVKYIPLVENNLLYNLFLYTTVVGGTIVISWLSYITIEKYFLKMKVQFETK